MSTTHELELIASVNAQFEQEKELRRKERNKRKAKRRLLREKK